MAVSIGTKPAAVTISWGEPIEALEIMELNQPLPIARVNGNRGTSLWIVNGCLPSPMNVNGDSKPSQTAL